VGHDYAAFTAELDIASGWLHRPSAAWWRSLSDQDQPLQAELGS
jgi:hypothetical protein